MTDYSHLPEYNIKLLLQKNAIELNILSLAQNKPMTDLVLLDPGLTLLALRYRVLQMTTLHFHHLSIRRFMKALTNYIFFESFVIEDYENVFR